MPQSSLADSIHDRLRAETRCELRFDRPGRMLYSTDASLYQVEPMGVAVPRTREDLRIAVQVAAELGAAVVPRGAATSLSGQTIGKALILDVSKYLNRIGIVDRDQGLVTVEPGVVLDQLNAHLKPLGLMFGPDVSTSDRATLGGMIGNNSAGARSLRYGKMVDHVVSLDVLLDDGSSATFKPLDVHELDGVCSRNDRFGSLHREVRSIAREHEQAIRDRFPHILRRVSGFNLDEFVPGLPVRPVDWPHEPWRFNLSRLVVGSEGTLAVVSGALVKVVPAPKRQGLTVLSFSSMAAALDNVGAILEAEPVSIELLDKLILDLAAANPDYARHLTFCTGRPAAVLSVQFYADNDSELEAKAQKLARKFEGKPSVVGVHTALTSSASADFWKVRKGGLALLMGMIGDAKPSAFVEDVAVSSDRLPEFHRRFEELLRNHGTSAACYGHADVGCLHIRPILNLKTETGVESLRLDRQGRLGPRRRIRRSDEWGTRRRYGQKHLEQEAFRRRGLLRVRASETRLRSHQQVEPWQGRRRSGSWRIAAHFSQLPRPGAFVHDLRLFETGGLRKSSGALFRRRGLSQDQQRYNVPKLYDHAR